LVSTIDFFYPLVEDPYLQGRIGCVNVLSDMYSMGISHIDNMLMTLAVSRNMQKEHQHIVSKRMIEGFNDAAKEAGTLVTGGQTVFNPWPIIGGVAMSTCHANQIIRPENAVPGDVLVLTKPLGTQLAVNLHQWFLKKDKHWDKVKDLVTEAEVHVAYNAAINQMGRLNRNGALLMQKYGAHACTDVTGFGILGHSQNLASNQKAKVLFRLTVLPILKNMIKVENIEKIFRLLQGLSSETSGGLLVALPSNSAVAFVAELQEFDGAPAWIIGEVLPQKTELPNRAEISVEVELMEV